MSSSTALRPWRPGILLSMKINAPVNGSVPMPVVTRHHERYSRRVQYGLWPSRLALQTIRRKAWHRRAGSYGCRARLNKIWHRALAPHRLTSGGGATCALSGSRPRACPRRVIQSEVSRASRLTRSQAGIVRGDHAVLAPRRHGDRGRPSHPLSLRRNEIDRCNRRLSSSKGAINALREIFGVCRGNEIRARYVLPYSRGTSHHRMSRQANAKIASTVKYNCWLASRNGVWKNGRGDVASSMATIGARFLL